MNVWNKNTQFFLSSSHIRLTNFLVSSEFNGVMRVGGGMGMDDPTLGSIAANFYKPLFK